MADLENGHSVQAVYWRMVPKRSAEDVFRRRFESRQDAEDMQAFLHKRHTYKVVGYNADGKLVPDA